MGEPRLLHHRLYFHHRSASITTPTDAIEVIDLTDEADLNGEQRARNVLLQGYLASGRSLGLGTGDRS